jgi:hypothetical protein
VLEKIVALFPALTLGVYSRDEMGNYFVDGTISAAGTDLHDDEEAMQERDAMMCGGGNDPCLPAAKPLEPGASPFPPDKEIKF